jgi:hypothetical protein
MGGVRFFFKCVRLVEGSGSRGEHGTYCSRRDAYPGSARLNKFLRTLNTERNHSVLLYITRGETYRNSPRTGSKPAPIESRIRCKLSFSIQGRCSAGGRVRNITVVMS